MDDKAKAQALKEEGNAYLSQERYADAIKKYTEAIHLDATNHVLYSNRSAAYAKLENFEAALKDAEKTVSLKPDWSKGYSRKGTALLYLNRIKEAEEAYKAGLKIDPNNDQLKSGLKECESKEFNAHMTFSSPRMMAKLAMDPRTREYLNDPSYIEMLKDLDRDPNNMRKYATSKSLLTTINVLLGLEINGADDLDLESQQRSPSPPKPSPPSHKPESMEVDLSPEQAAAKQEKEKGNKAYRNKDFDTAVKHYEKAREIDPTDMTFLINLAAVRFEQKDYDECIKLCEEAVDVGRENRADFKLIAKALTRVGNAYRQKQDYHKAKVYFEKSMSEHRTPETKNLLSQVEKMIKEQERLSYIDVSKAEEAKELGNECFKKGDYPTAVKHYTEAVKRNPNDARLFSNRAACYTKLAEFNLGLKDCDDCIKLDPTFIKGYIRKAKIQQGLKQFSQAQESYQKALDVDPKHPEALEGLRECITIANNDPEEARKRAMADPEVQQILKDPAMRIILEQMQSDPRALQDHLRNPDISAKIQKLMQCGLISIR